MSTQFLTSLFEFGISRDLFQDPDFDESLICPVCTDILNNPHQCTNGHMFCLKCINICLRTKTECPTCNTKMSRDYLCLNLFAKQTIGKMKVKCCSAIRPREEEETPADITEDTCDWVGSLNNLEHHKSECQLSTIICPHIGCENEIMRLHLNNHCQTCAFRIEKCDYCGIESQYNKLIDHHSDCHKYPVDCVNGCETTGLIREDIPHHLLSCPLQLVPCPWCEIIGKCDGMSNVNTICKDSKVLRKSVPEFANDPLNLIKALETLIVNSKSVEFEIKTLRQQFQSNKEIFEFKISEIVNKITSKDDFTNLGNQFLQTQFQTLKENLAIDNVSNSDELDDLQATIASVSSKLEHLLLVTVRLQFDKTCTLLSSTSSSPNNEIIFEVQEFAKLISNINLKSSDLKIKINSEKLFNDSKFITLLAEYENVSQSNVWLVQYPAPVALTSENTFPPLVRLTVDEVDGALSTLSTAGMNAYSEESIVDFLQSVYNFIDGQQTHQQVLGDIGGCDFVALIMNKFLLSSIKISEVCFKVVRILCRNSDNMSTSYEANILKFSKNGSLRDVVSIMTMYGSKSEGIAKEGLMVIHRLAFNSETASQLGKIGVCDILPMCLTIHKHSADVVEWCFRAIRNLSAGGNDDNRGKLSMAPHMCQSVVQSSEYHLQNALVIEQACGAILNLAVNDKCKVEFGQAGVCNLVCRTLEVFIDNVIVSEQACWAIRNLSSSPENKKLLGLAGVCGNICNVMRTHLSSVNVVEQGCRAILNLVISDDNDRKCGEAGACELLVEVMKTHASNTIVSMQSCWAIRNMAASNNSNRVKFGVAGACGTIVQAINNHVQDAGVVEQACRAILNLAVENGNEVRLGRAGACTAVVKVLTHHPDNTVVIEQALWAVRNLAAGGNAENRLNLGRSGINEQVVIATSKYISHTGIAEQGCRAMLNLAVDKENSKRLGEVGACELVVEILDLYASTIAEQGLRAIYNLSVNEANAMKLGNVGAIPVVVKAFGNLVENPVIGEWGCKAAMNLSAGNNSMNRTKLGEAGVCPIIVRALQMHLAISMIAEKGSIAIYNISANNAENKNRFATAGAADILRQVIEHHSTDRKIVSEATDALTRIGN